MLPFSIPHIITMYRLHSLLYTLIVSRIGRLSHVSVWAMSAPHTCHKCLSPALSQALAGRARLRSGDTRACSCSGDGIGRA